MTELKSCAASKKKTKKLVDCGFTRKKPFKFFVHIVSKDHRETVEKRKESAIKIF